MSHGGGGGDRWLVSYADFMTLLMILFLVLYSMGQTDLQKYKKLADGLSEAFGGPERIVDPEISQIGGITSESDASPVIIEDLPSTNISPEDVAAEITDRLAQYGMMGDISVENNIEGILISLSEQLLFFQGTGDLQPEAYPVLDQIAVIMLSVDNSIRVTGYTDESIPLDSRYRNNWELSVGRAVIIVEYLISKGMSPERLIAAGKGQYDSLYPNDGPQSMLNSRAEITIIYPVGPDIIDFNIFGNPLE